MKLLFISYNGSTDPLFHTQGLRYLRGLRARGLQVHVLSYERRLGSRDAARQAVEQLRQELARDGVVWHRLRYHKWPPVLSTMFDVASGIACAWRIVMRHRITLLHARGTIPAAVAAPVARWTGRPWLLDLRGVVSEEYVDGGLWARGSWLHQSVGMIERGLIRRADALVVLTERAAEILTQDRSWRLPAGITPQVIPCCADLEPRPQERGALPGDLAHRLTGRFVLAYVGSLGTWYLLEEMVAFYRGLLARKPEAHLLVLTQQEHRALAQQALERLPRAAEQTTVVSVPPDMVGGYLACAHAGMAFIKPTFSKQFSSPTKIGEYLANGVPVVVNEGVGDLDRLVSRSRVGVVLRGLHEAGIAQGVTELLELVQDPALADRCRQAARDHLSADWGRDRYWAIYQRLAGERERG